jgi:hypothetical protein
MSDCTTQRGRLDWLGSTKASSAKLCRLDLHASSQELHGVRVIASSCSPLRSSSLLAVHGFTQMPSADEQLHLPRVTKPVHTVLIVTIVIV